MTTATDEFDADTAPPRRRPQGDPPPRFSRLPAGESAEETFAGWAEAGRVPAGAILCRCAGTEFGRAGHSGYRVVAGPAPVKAGRHLSDAERAGYTLRVPGLGQVVLVEAGAAGTPFVVLVPKGDA